MEKQRPEIAPAGPTYARAVRAGNMLFGNCPRRAHLRASGPSRQYAVHLRLYGQGDLGTGWASHRAA